MKEPSTPRGWAVQLTTILNTHAAVGGTCRFPVDVALLAKQFSQQRYPSEPIAEVEGEELSRFEGCLLPFEDESGRWGIIYNKAATPGRVRFTLAHEFGHYLLHRRGAAKYGIRCSVRDVSGGHPGLKTIEREADEFAAWLLMPLDDLRRQIPPRSKPDLHRLSEVAERYGTSLLSTCLRWVECTEQRALVVVSREGYVDWARSSTAAVRTGAVIRTSSRPPVELPPASLAANLANAGDPKAGVSLGKDIWFDSTSTEMAVVADAYDFTLSVVVLGDPPDRDWATD